MPPTVRPSASALLLNGTVGVGKTSTAEAIGDLLSAAGVAYALIDVDWLRRCHPSPPGDPFQHDLTLRNLRSVAAAFRDAGAARLVLAGVLETPQQRSDYSAAVGTDLAVIRLRADLDVIRSRLARRHEQVSGLDWHLRRCGELDAILDAAAVDDLTEVTDGRSPAEVATAVLAAVGWDDHYRFAP
jgi:adenylylsulfate kinase